VHDVAMLRRIVKRLPPWCPFYEWVTRHEDVFSLIKDDYLMYGRSVLDIVNDIPHDRCMILRGDAMADFQGPGNPITL